MQKEQTIWKMKENLTKITPDKNEENIAAKIEEK